MNLQGRVKVLSEMRDLQVVDQNGNNCGICDDVEFQGAPGRPLVLHGLLIGTAPLLYRLPFWFSRFVGLVVPSYIVRVPFEDVEIVTSRIKLKHPAAHYGLLRTDDHLARFFKWIPSL
jgi:hypothetical protein